MVFTRNSSIYQFLAFWIHILNFLEGSLEAQGLLERFGMNATQLQRGRALLTQLQAALQQVGEQRSKQKAATDSFRAEWRKARQLYQLHVQAARRGLGRDASHFVSASPKRYLAWLTQAQAFYAALLDNAGYLEQMRQLGVPTEELQRASQMVATMVGNKDLQTQHLAEKRTAMRQRDLAFVEAKQWFEALDKVARIAFRQQPALLKAIRPLELPQSQGEDTPTQTKVIKKTPAKINATAVSEAPSAEVQPISQDASIQLV
ncbi:MAG: hypothetical protein U0175_13470 [Caldilineaceae bacterium]